MGRRPKERYLAGARYAQFWTDMGGTVSDGVMFDNVAEAMQWAAERVAEMRAGGVRSAMREVSVKLWPQDGPLLGAPKLFTESFYDPEQGLTQAQAYAARVHDWHAVVDAFNYRAARNNVGKQSYFGMGYGNWNDDWGSVPAECPACGETVDLPDHRFPPNPRPALWASFNRIDSGAPHPTESSA